jgi:hypothetical protein
LSVAGRPVNVSGSAWHLCLRYVPEFSEQAPGRGGPAEARRDLDQLGAAAEILDQVALARSLMVGPGSDRCGYGVHRVFWKPIYCQLEDDWVWLVNGPHIKHVPERKTRSTLGG